MAIERTGRPATEWRTRYDVWGTEDRRTLLVVSAAETNEAPAGGADGEIRDLDPMDLTFTLAYTVAHADLQWLPNADPGRALTTKSEHLTLGIAVVGKGGDDELLREVAAELGNATNLDFDIAEAALDAGFEYVGSGPGDLTNLTDYTLGWAPEEFAGNDREEAVELGTKGPGLWVNAGARFYGQDEPAAPSAAAAPIEHNSGSSSIAFRLDGSLIRVGGRGVSEKTLRDFAASLESVPRSEWREALAPRLLADPPTG